jgi:predicted phage terminase large subunit-like protein
MNLSLPNSEQEWDRQWKALQTEKYRRWLIEFVRAAWPVIEPVTPLIEGFHVPAICEHLQAVTEGRIKRLLINVPPRCGKSNLVSVLWPCWEWTRDPSIRFLMASYSLDLSTRHSLMRRRLIESEWYRSHWPSVKLTSDQNAKREFENDCTGYMIATSVGGTSTGRGGSRLLLDDPHSVSEAESDVVRQSVLEWFDRTWSTRSNNPQKPREVVIMQRVHFKDVSGHMLEQGDVEHLKIPMEYDPDTARTTSIGWSDPRKERGQLLAPQWFTPDVVKQYKLRLGSYAYAGQYQQTPVPAEGGIFKKHWLRYFRWGDPGWLVIDDGRRFQLSTLSRFITVDLAASLRETADYTVISSWAFFNGSNSPKLFLLDVVRSRMEGPDIVPSVKAQRAKWNVPVVWIEKVGFQPALIQAARREGLPVRELERTKDKIGRAMGATPLYEAGNVHYPADASWLAECETELLSFPAGEHDDFTDCASDAANIAQDMVSCGYDLVAGIDKTAPLNPMTEKFFDMIPGESKVNRRFYG